MRAALADASDVLASDLTLVECDRGLIRAHSALRLRESDVAKRHSMLESAASRWTLLRLTPAIIERARRPFPGDPVRTLDALHLASALAAADTSDDLGVLSLDRRVRSSAQALGLEIVPELTAAPYRA